MANYRILLEELDRCDYVPDYEYKGALDDYTYNGVTYLQGSVSYYSQLLQLYRNFLYEWTPLSDIDKNVVRQIFNEIKSKRYIHGSFFFDVPSRDTVVSMLHDNGVPQKDVEMARFVCDMSEQQQYFLLELMHFLEADDEPENLLKKTDVEIAVELLSEYPDILSTSEVAKIFDKSEYTIREWERKGILINVAGDAYNDKGINSNGHRKRRMALQFRKCDIIKDINLRAMLKRLLL